MKSDQDSTFGGIASALAWLERFAVRIEFQRLPVSRRRQKNRVILQFSDASGTVETCGGTTLIRAINRARLRSELTAIEAELARENRPELSL